LLSLLQWVLIMSVSLQLTVVKENWSEKMSTRQKLGKNSLFKESKEERTFFKWFLISTIELLIFTCCFSIRSCYTVRSGLLGVLIVKQEEEDMLFRKVCYM